MFAHLKLLLWTALLAAVGQACAYLPWGAIVYWTAALSGLLITGPWMHAVGTALETRKAERAHRCAEYAAAPAAVREAMLYAIREERLAAARAALRDELSGPQSELADAGQMVPRPGSHSALYTCHCTCVLFSRWCVHCGCCRCHQGRWFSSRASAHPCGGSASSNPLPAARARGRASRAAATRSTTRREQSPMLLSWSAARWPHDKRQVRSESGKELTLRSEERSECDVRGVWRQIGIIYFRRG